MNQLGLELPVVPNGVNLDIFHPMDYAEARKEVGFQDGKKYVIWCSHPERPEKNWALAEAAIAYLNEKNKKNTADAAKTIKIESNQKSGDSVCCEQHPQNECSASSLVSELPSQTQPVPSDSVQSAESSPYKKVDCINLEKSEKNDADAVLVAVYDKTPEEVCRYMDAADCLLLTSVSEGSPNVIKEAMACNCPIVTTDVGDVNERLANLEGCFVVPDNELDSERVREVGEAIEKALTFGKRTEGRKRLIEDGLTVELNAKKIMNLYEPL